MSSILTNTAAMTALQTLQQTNEMMEATQNRISSGLRITTAADNSAYWSIAATMKSDNSSLSTVKDALGLGAATVDVAYTAMESATSLVTEIKSKLVAARQPGVDKGKIQHEISQLQNQLKSVVGSASFSGENWLINPSDGTDRATDGLPTITKEIVSSFTRKADGTVETGKISITISDFILIDEDGAAANKSGLLDQATDNGAVVPGYAAGSGNGSGESVLNLKVQTVAGTVTTDKTEAQIDVLIREITIVEDSMIDATASLGAARNRINLQNDFVANLMDAIDRGVGQLIDADMTEESSRLKSLQVQQQLGIQSLSIANANAQNILALFR